MRLRRFHRLLIFRRCFLHVSLPLFFRHAPSHAAVAFSLFSYFCHAAAYGVIFHTIATITPCRADAIMRVTRRFF